MILKTNSLGVWPLKDKSVQAIITSPPYYSLRSYQIPDVIIGGDLNHEHVFIPKARKMPNASDGQVGKQTTNRGACFVDYHKREIKSGYCSCGAWYGQYGQESDFKDFVTHTLLWTQEAYRVLREDGTFFLNVGDSYNDSGGSHKEWHKNDTGFQGEYGVSCAADGTHQNYPSKSLLLIPERIVIGLSDQGWIIRNVIIWHSNNKMCEPHRDRFTKKYEFIFLCVKNSSKNLWWYHKDKKQWTQQAPEPDYVYINNSTNESTKVEPEQWRTITYVDRRGKELPLWRRRNLWIGLDTYFDLDSVRVKAPPLNRWGGDRLIAKGHSDWDEGTGHSTYRDRDMQPNDGMKNPGDVFSVPTRPLKEQHFASYPVELIKPLVLCSTRLKDVVLDPFVGSGTTVKVAEELGRQGVGFDLGYHDISNRRLDKITPAFL